MRGIEFFAFSTEYMELFGSFLYTSISIFAVIGLPEESLIEIPKTLFSHFLYAGARLEDIFIFSAAIVWESNKEAEEVFPSSAKISAEITVG